jgi:hypothetical protein
MKMKLMIAAILASASMAHAGPPITPAKIKKPLHLSQVKSIFPHAEPTVPAQKETAPVQKESASVKKGSKAGTPAQQASTSVQQADSGTSEPTAAPVSRKVHLNTFLNHPSSAPGPK